MLYKKGFKSDSYTIVGRKSTTLTVSCECGIRFYISLRKFKQLGKCQYCISK